MWFISNCWWHRAEKIWHKWLCQLHLCLNCTKFLRPCLMNHFWFDVNVMDDDAILSHSVSEGHFMLIANSYETRMIPRDKKLPLTKKCHKVYLSTYNFLSIKIQHTDSRYLIFWKVVVLSNNKLNSIFFKFCQCKEVF